MQKQTRAQYLEANKEFLETNYPRGRAIGVFRSFHPDCHREPKFCYLDSRFYGNDNF